MDQSQTDFTPGKAEEAEVTERACTYSPPGLGKYGGACPMRINIFARASAGGVKFFFPLSFKKVGKNPSYFSTLAAGNVENPTQLLVTRRTVGGVSYNKK